MTPNKPTRRRRLAKALIIAAIIFGTLMMLLATLLIMFPYESRHSDGTTLPHHQRNPEAKAHMLALINSLRTAHDSPPAALSKNDSAQLHADFMLRDCTTSHWGTDGLKPYMRHSLAGGHHRSAENVYSANECGLSDTSR